MARVRNVHERSLPAMPKEVGALLDGLASDHDRLWPGDKWWPQRFDGGLVVGAKGGHGPIRYKVESYEPGVRVVCRFPPKGGFDGTHTFEVMPADNGTTVLRHSLEVRTYGRGVFLWPLIRPLHDALVEDALDNAERAVTGKVVEPARYSAYVGFARRFVRGTGHPAP